MLTGTDSVRTKHKLASTLVDIVVQRGRFSARYSGYVLLYSCSVVGIVAKLVVAKGL